MSLLEIPFHTFGNGGKSYWPGMQAASRSCSPPAKKPQSYNRKELNSANHLNEQENRPSPRASKRPPTALQPWDTPSGDLAVPTRIPTGKNVR